LDPRKLGKKRFLQIGGGEKDDFDVIYIPLDLPERKTL